MKSSVYEASSKESGTLWHKVGEWHPKKINDPVRTFKGRQKAEIVDQIRAYQVKLTKKQRYRIGDILSAIGLKKATYHNERKRIKNHTDRYADIKIKIKKITENGKHRGRLTYGY